MNRDVAKFTICTIYLSFFALNCALILYAWQSYFLTDTTMVEMLKHLGQTYAPAGALIIAGIFKGSQSSSERNAVTMFLFLASLIVILTWNMLVTWPFAYLVIKAGPEGMNVTWMADYWKAATEMIQFLTAVPLTYFYLQDD